jgi:hypothetical protein
MIFHRLESPTQTSAVALEQERTFEIWGNPSRYSDVPRVKAFVGRLPEGARGVEFHTDVRPDRGLPPGRAEWTPGRPGVVLVDNTARLSVDLVLNRQLEEKT